MKKALILVSLILLVSIIILSLTKKNELPTLENLTIQINGGKCMYVENNGKPIRRSIISDLNRRNVAERCIIDAAKLLAIMHNENIDTVPVLIQALQNNQNIDTGDGIILVRSEIALALGRIGDKRALVPLEEILASEDRAIPSKNGSFKEGYKTQKGTSHDAVTIAIEQINKNI